MYEEVQVLTHSSIRIAGNQIILIHFMWRKKPVMLILFA